MQRGGCKSLRYYRVAKESCNRLGIDFARTCGIEFFWPIITNIYGEGEESERFIISMLRTLKMNKDFKMTSGKQMYDFIHLEDATDAFYRIAQYGIVGRKYVIGSGDVKPLKEWVKDIPKIIGSKGRLLFGESDYHGVNLDKDVFSTSELTEDTGFYPKIDFKCRIKSVADRVI